MDDAVLVANRFVALQNGTHLDLATSAIVRLTRRPIEEQMRATLEEEGARLCRLWHPAMSPYLDFGPLGEADWFEAVGIGSPGAIPAAAVGCGDVGAFLRAQDLRSVTLEQSSLDLFSPSLLAAREERDNGGCAIVPHTIRGFGIRLLPPQLISGVTSWLEETLDAGPHVWSIDAPPRSGWRTCWQMLAREARRTGFVPVDSNLLARAVRGPSGAVGTWLAALRDRSLLVAHHAEAWTEVARHNLAALIVVIGGLHSSTAVILDIVRTGRPVCARFALDAFSPFTLARAAWTGVPAIGERRLRAIAIRAQGRPAEFVAAVSRLVNARDGGSPTVHERRPGHGPYSSGLDSAAIDRVLGRVRILESRGRHAEAVRMLRRGHAALDRRGQGSADPRLWAELAVREGERRVSPALGEWMRAWAQVGARGECHGLIDAIPLVAIAWIRDAAVIGAERLLRAAIAAALGAGLQPPPMLALLLAESLYWQNRLPEVRVVLADATHERATGLLARAALRAGDAAAALRQAGAAIERARGVGDAAALAAGLVARLRAEAVVGDLDGVAATTDALQSGTDQEDSFFVDEIVLALAETSTFLRREWPASVRERVTALSARTVPRLSRARARTALALSDPRCSLSTVLEEVRRVTIVTGARALLPADVPYPPWPATPQSRSTPMVHDIVSILQACQQDDDPPAVVRRVTSIVRERTASTGVAVFSAEDCGLVPRARFGRLPRVRLGERAVALRSAVGPEHERGIWEAAWPILHRDVLAGAIVCQWDRLEARPASELVSLAATAAAALGPVVDQLRAPNVPAPSTTGKGAIAELLGSSDVMTRIRHAIDRAALAPFPVVIEGESGAGKELVARAIHERGPRRARAFCAVNCAALTDDLFEAELFGHARGAFTGAIADRAGLFEHADGGTLLLDEVIELSPRAQAKLLRALQEGEIRRVGETRSRRVDVRIIAACNRSLQSGVASGSFRADLRFRLDVLRIELPALRARSEDVVELARHFWSRAATRVGSRAQLGPDVLAAFARYDWPGNVRELQNAVAALAASAPARGIVRASALPAQIHLAERGNILTLEEARRRFEAGFVRAAIARAGGSRGRAAADLGVTRQGLSKLLERLGLDDGTGSVNGRTGEHEEIQA
jgi:DNA-binding NtrC family response regulator